MVNMLSFSGYEAFPERWTSPVDQAVASSIQFFFRIKFVALFSALFGLGFALQAARAEARGVNFIPLYLRRLGILLVFGSLHVLLDPLEVLHQYALVGLLLPLFHRRSDRALLATAVVFLLLPFALQVATAAGGTGTDVETQGTQDISAQGEPGPRESEWPPRPDERLYSDGTFAEIASHNARQILVQRSAPIGYVWMLQVLPFFLIGLYVGRREILQDVDAHRPLIRKSLWWGLAWGVTLTCAATVLPSLSDLAAAQWTYLLAGVAFVVGGPGLTIFYASSIVLLAQREAWKERLAPLAAVGRMALTNYLLQTLIATSIFYGYGLGLYGTIGPAAGLALTVVIFALQVATSVWWMGRFRFGPLEWLWRTLTYANIQAMR